MLHLISDFITLPLPNFCEKTGLGETLVREWIKDGRIKAFRAGKKRLLVVVQSYLDLVQRQMVEGMPEYDPAKKAREARRQKQAAAEVKPKTARRAVDLADLDLL